METFEERVAKVSFCRESLTALRVAMAVLYTFTICLLLGSYVVPFRLADALHGRFGYATWTIPVAGWLATGAAGLWMGRMAHNLLRLREFIEKELGQL